MSNTLPSKEAIAIILDVSHSIDAETLSLMKQACADLILQKQVYSPKDEIGIIFAGTQGTKNRLNTQKPDRYKNITVMKPVLNPTSEYYTDINNAMPECGKIDIFEAILCAADLIKETTKDKKYRRRIFLISRVADTVANKKDLTEIQNGLKSLGISLLVIGVDFTVSDEDEWSKLTTAKQQNERVLAILCTQLGEGSLIFPLSDAIDALSDLRKRNFSERTVSRAVLTIGDVKIPAHIYTKTLLNSLPTLKKTTNTEGDSVIVDRRHFKASDMQEVDASERIKALKYGRSVVPCTAIDEDQMKFVSERGLDCLGFINTSDIPSHILLGGVKAIGPCPGDQQGASALAAFIHGMIHLNKAMLVRFTLRTNSEPVIAACFPSAKEDRHILYMATLPFAEDFRRYILPDFAETNISPDDAKSIDEMISSMTLTNDDIKLNKIYNPALQQYFTWVRARYLQGIQHKVDPAHAVGMSLPPIPDAVKRSATCWGEPGNILHGRLSSTAATSARLKVASAFPYTPPAATNAPGGSAKQYWFGQGPNISQQSEVSSLIPGQKPPKKGRHEKVTSNSLQAFTAQSTSDHYFSSVSASQNTTPILSTPATTHAQAAIDTVNPVASFLAMVHNPNEDLVKTAIFKMTDLIFTLLKMSIGTQFYTKCEDCVKALREVCRKEGEPQEYLVFMRNLMSYTKGGGTHDDFWQKHIASNHLGPITSSECTDSTMTDQEAEQFMANAVIIPIIPEIDEDNVEEDNFLDQLE